MQKVYLKSASVAMRKWYDEKEGRSVGLKPDFSRSALSDGPMESAADVLCRRFLPSQHVDSAK
jgi:hypothetical protein